MRHVRRPLVDRFWAKVQIGDPGQCQPWLGATSKKRGQTRRGHIKLGGRHGPNVLAHVVALALQDPDDYQQLLSTGTVLKYHPETGERLQACHSCSAKWGNCMNGSHLYWGTRAENEADRRRARLAEIEQAIT